MSKKILVVVAMALLAAAGFAAGVGWQTYRSVPPEEELPVSGSQEAPDAGQGLPDLNRMTEEEKEAYFGEIVEKDVQKYLEQIERRTDD